MRIAIEGRSKAQRATTIVQELINEFPLAMLLEILDLSRSTYYYQLKPLNKEEKDKAIKAEIKSIYNEHKGNYGYRRIHLELRNRGFMINHKKVPNV